MSRSLEVSLVGGVEVEGRHCWGLGSLLGLARLWRICLRLLVGVELEIVVWEMVHAVVGGWKKDLEAAGLRVSRLQWPSSSTVVGVEVDLALLHCLQYSAD